jgi:cyclase
MGCTLERAKNRLSPFRPAALALMMTGMTLCLYGQSKTDRTLTQKAIDQYENTPLRTTAFGEHIFVFSGDGANVVAIVSSGSTLLIDSGVASRANELYEAVARATGRPIETLVNTDWHFDHTGGNLYFGESGVTVIAQKNVKKWLSTRHETPFVGLDDGPYPSQALPSQDYGDTMNLHQGSENLNLVNYGRAHTDGDTVIYLKDANIVVTGELFSNAFYPIIDYSSGGSIDGLINAVDQILVHSDSQTKIVPGHGPVATRADLQEYNDMLRRVRERVQGLLSTGKTLQEVVDKAPTKEFDAKWGTGYVTPDVFVQMVYSSLSSGIAQGVNR